MLTDYLPTMRTSWLMGALVTFIIGVVFSITIVGLVIGVPLIILSLILLILGLIIPGQRTKVKIHQEVHVGSQVKK